MSRQPVSAPAPVVSRGELLPVRTGFLPLVDAALLVAAREQGFAAEEGIDLALVREGSWAAVRDKLNVGLFDAAHMLAPAAAASAMGIGHLKVPLFAPVALNLDGNAITVSRAIAGQLRARIGRGSDSVSPDQTAHAMADIVAERRRAGEEPLTFGIVFGFSCHLYQLRAWLALGGLDPDSDARFVVIPPSLMVESLGAGLIDVFCAGSPWNRIAELAGVGHVLHASAQIAPGSIEKLLVLRQDREAEPWLPGMIRALAKASDWASAPENRSSLADLLARPEYIGASATVINDILAGTGELLFGRSSVPWIRLDRDAITPSIGRAEQMMKAMDLAGHMPAGINETRIVTDLIRPDVFAAALDSR